VAGTEGGVWRTAKYGKKWQKRGGGLAAPERAGSSIKIELVALYLRDLICVSLNPRQTFS